MGLFNWFEARVDPFPEARPEQPPRTVYAFCRYYARGLGPMLAIMAISAGIIAVLETLLFSGMGRLVDWLATIDKGRFFVDYGTEAIAIGAAIIILLPLMQLLNGLALHQSLAGNFPMRVRWKAHRYLLEQSMAFFQYEFAGRIATKVMQTALAVREVVIKLLDVMLYVAVYLVLMLFIFADADWRLAVPLVIWLGAYCGMLAFFLPRLSRASEAQADARSIMTGRVVDAYTNIQSVKLFAHARREETYAREGMAGFLRTVHWQMGLVTWLQVLLYLINAILLVSVTAYGIHLWTNDAMTLGAIATAIALVLRLEGMSNWILWEISALFENLGTVHDGIDLLARPQTVLDKPQAQDLDVKRGQIDFEGIVFTYGKTGRVIDHLTLSIAPGEKVGLVGRSGAGKSTLVNLLLRFHDVDGGRILIDGQDIAAVRQESLREQIGMVTQDTALLHRSVRDNIRYGRPNASHEEVIDAARRARADEFIANLADAKGRAAYDAQVGERGVKLSGGQRQRIAIARIFLKDAPILILDEATSALDSEAEAAIQQSLNALMRDKTVIAIAHRLSTIASLDRLIVLDEGQIVEEGTHESLIALGGIYAGLWNRQSGGFLGLDAA